MNYGFAVVIRGSFPTKGLHVFEHAKCPACGFRADLFGPRRAPVLHKQVFWKCLNPNCDWTRPFT